MQSLPRLKELIQKQDKTLFYLDESTFTYNQTKISSWWPTRAFAPTVERSALSFKAIGVIAAINTDGEVVAHQAKEGAILKNDIIDFLNKLRDINKGKPAAVYLDNLRAHHSVVVRECAEKNNQELVFSGSYASELNPIEIAWAWAKRSFQTKMATHADMRDTEAIIAKVNESIEELKACSIKKHVEKCFERISVYLEHIEADPGFTISQKRRSKMSDEEKPENVDMPQAEPQPQPQSARAKRAPGRRDARYWSQADFEEQKEPQQKKQEPSQQPPQEEPKPNDIHNEDSDQQQQQQHFGGPHRPNFNSFSANEVVGVPRDELVKTVNSKPDVYRALSISGQYYLAPYRQCTFHFLRDILRKKKKVFKRTEVTTPAIPYLPQFTLKRLIEAAKKCPAALDYLPDPEDLVPKRVNREFLATIIHTLDPTYFTEIIEKSEQIKRTVKAQKEQNTVVQVDKEMLKVLQNYLGRKKPVKRTSIHLLGVAAKKRKRSERSRSGANFFEGREIKPQKRQRTQ